MEPFQVEGCGMACTIISTEVLRKVQTRFGNCFTPVEEFGEDLAFCWRAKKMGTEIWCEPTARVGHLAHVPVYPDSKPSV